MSKSKPLISIITPVYNGEKYLSDCIESVLAQTYTNWELIIVNNSSTDRTPEIIEYYCEKDSRIHVYSTDTLIPAIENHNFALSKISLQSKYCKILQGDDILFPECILRMAELGLENPNVGVISSYSLFGNRVKCDGIEFTSSVIPGQEICRLTLLGRTYPFISPSALMIRSDLVRARPVFYDVEYLHGDLVPMYELLQECDFGFIHQVLSYIRVHQDSATSTLAKPLNTIIWSNFYLFTQFGKVFLSGDEFNQRLNWHLNKYYNFLASSFFEIRNLDFWRYHISGFRQVGYRLSYFRLIASIFAALICKPRVSGGKLFRALGLKK